MAERLCHRLPVARAPSGPCGAGCEFPPRADQSAKLSEHVVGPAICLGGRGGGHGLFGLCAGAGTRGGGQRPALLRRYGQRQLCHADGGGAAGRRACLPGRSAARRPHVRPRRHADRGPDRSAGPAPRLRHLAARPCRGAGAGNRGRVAAHRPQRACRRDRARHRQSRRLRPVDAGSAVDGHGRSGADRRSGPGAGRDSGRRAPARPGRRSGRCGHAHRPAAGQFRRGTGGRDPVGHRHPDRASCGRRHRLPDHPALFHRGRPAGRPHAGRTRPTHGRSAGGHRLQRGSGGPVDHHRPAARRVRDRQPEPDRGGRAVGPRLAARRHPDRNDRVPQRPLRRLGRIRGRGHLATGLPSAGGDAGQLPPPGGHGRGLLPRRSPGLDR